MNTILTFTKDESPDNNVFSETVLTCIAATLRLTKNVMPFLKDKQQYILYIVRLMKTHINNQALTLACLNIIKLVCFDETSTQLVIDQFQSLSILILSVIDHNQTNVEIVVSSIRCLKPLMSGGKDLEEAEELKLFKQIINRKELKNLRKLLDGIKAEKQLKSEDEFLRYLNRDAYSDAYPKLPLRIEVSDKFLIQAEKYLSEIRSRYEKTKKALADKTFFVDGDAQDDEIEMSGESMDESEHDSIDTLDDNLYESDAAD